MQTNVSTVMMVEKSISVDPEGNPLTIRHLSKGETPVISFSNADLVGVALPHNDPLVIKIRIDVQNVKRVLVDPGSSIDIIYKNLFDRMKRISLKRIGHPIYSFSGQLIWPLEVALLNVKLGPKTITVDFVVVDVEAYFNAILG